MLDVPSGVLEERNGKLMPTLIMAELSLIIHMVEPLIADAPSLDTHVANGQPMGDMDMVTTPCLVTLTSQDLVSVFILEEYLVVVNAQQSLVMDTVTMPCLAIPISQDPVLATTQEVFSPVSQ